MAKKVKFTHLHVHSHYSLLDGLSKIPDLVSRAKELGMDSLALTDHGVMYGAVEFYKECKKQGIKPIIGNELYLARDKLESKKPNVDNKNYHIILLAKNEIGYKNLVKLTTIAHLKGFYYKPRIDEETLAKYSEGLICSSACLQGKIPRLIASNRIEEAEKSIKKFQEIFGKENFYLELQHHPKIDTQEKVNKELIKLSKKTGAQLIATCDSHYLRKEDAEAHDILILINTGADRNDAERMTMKDMDLSLKSPEEMAKIFKDVPEAISNTQKIAEQCNFDFILGKTKLPKYDVPEGKTAFQYLKELTEEGLKNRYSKITKEIRNRVEEELSVIETTGFASYFLIVQDFINWAKGNRIVVGPGRGSAPGSIVSYALNITTIDPIEYGLLFERFLNKDRISMPDIDIDFTDRRRDEVIEYVSEKYGHNRVAQIITFGTMAARAVIRDVGRALGLAYDYCDKIAKMIPPLKFDLDRTLKEVKEFKNLYNNDPQAKKLIDYAKKLEGCARHSSKHACGVVISAEPLDNVVPLKHPSADDESIITQYEMHAIEDLGLLKMDFLGLKNLTIIEDTLNRIYKIHDKNINIQNIPLDDKKVYKIFQEGNTTGVFQFESDGFKRYLKELKPTEFNDLIAMVSLYRPGPIELIPTYIRRKNGKEKVEYLHPLMEPILKDTYGIMVYQEQVMRLARDMAGFTLSEADVLRKAIGKKIQSLMMAQKKKLIDGMNKNNIDKKISTQIWNWIEPFASYSFNKSHATAYATIAYQTAYLKNYYPVEFMSALLISEKGNTDRISVLIDECKKMNIKILPPDINESYREFSVVPKENQIRFGLFAIKNVGDAVVNIIISERKENGPFSSMEDFVTRVESKALNKKAMESMIKAGVFDRFEERGILLANLEDLLSWARQKQKSKEGGQKDLFGSLSDSDNTATLTLMSVDQTPTEKMLLWEKELLGLYVSDHPLEKYRKKLNGNTYQISKITSADFNISNQRVKIGGIVSSAKKIITKKGQTMMFLGIEDFTDKIEVVVFPAIYNQFENKLQENKILLVSGRIDYRDGSPKLICEDIKEILES